MKPNDYNRREFFKRFAALSSVSVLTLMQGCGSSSPGAAYGPGPVPPYGVSGIYYVDANSYWVYLNRATAVQNVPIDAPFEIVFSQPMDTTAPATVTFADAAGNAVAISKVWDNTQSLRVTPTAPLALNTGYTLSMGGDALDAQGHAIGQNQNSTVTFRTAAV